MHICVFFHLHIEGVLSTRALAREEDILWAQANEREDDRGPREKEWQPHFGGLFWLLNPLKVTK